MEGYAVISSISLAFILLIAIKRLEARVKELERPIQQRKREEALITRAEVTKMIEQSRKVRKDKI